MRDLTEVKEKTEYVLTKQQGLILGDATAISTRVHAVSPKKPGAIVAQAQDAGQVFYTRSNPNEIIHIDCFHQVGKVDHKELSNYLLARLENIIQDYSLPHDFMDFIDIQTGTGGGRLTGSLEFGKKETLKIAHQNHVHLALYLLPQNYQVLVPLIWYLEEGILEQGMELRKIYNMKIMPLAKNSQTQEGEDSSLEDYTSSTDSKLKERSDSNREASSLSSDKLNDVQQIAESEGKASQAQQTMEELAKGASKQNFLNSASRRKLLTYLKKIA
ncbi:hypothetical protein [Natranaerobius thermophilus]|uniref:hypothetical protein n=1 Tax=Natranaerobius thermophilus TaxID=375929 RepID=UPI002F3E96DC